MKRIGLYLIIVIIAFACNQANTEVYNNLTSEVISYDSVLVQKYEADKYGMKQYVVAFLKRGPNRNLDSTDAAELQKEHLKNIIRLEKEGKLVLAGPFTDDGDIRGIYIFNVKTIDEAKKLTETDPAIQKGSLVMELHPWYGSASLMAIPKLHKKLQKVSVAD